VGWGIDTLLMSANEMMTNGTTDGMGSDDLACFNRVSIPHL
jgi:hypothetical protein